MVSHCKNSYTSTFKEFYKNPTHITVETNNPVIDRDGFIYKNSFSAEYYGIIDFTLASIAIHCTGPLLKNKSQQ